MVVLFRKSHLWKCALFFCSMIGFTSILWAAYTLPFSTKQTFSSENSSPIIWIIDAGHGGEDGGAVSPIGITESGLNLDIALRTNDLLRFTGQRTRLTRADGNAIHTEGETIRARKASDIRNRVALVNGTENAVLVSIHQNSLPSSPVTHGAQVFWNRQEGGETLAQLVQDSLNGAINIGNEKQEKKIPDTIYLMKHVTAPAILVECGFLSHPEETKLLQDPSHQIKLAAAMTAGCLRALAGEELP